MRVRIFKRALCMATVLVTAVAMMPASIRLISGGTNINAAEAEAGYVSLQLMDKDGNPYVGIQTWLLDRDGEEVVAETTSDESGQVVITGLIVDEAYRFRVSGPEIHNGFMDVESWDGPILTEEKVGNSSSGGETAEEAPQQKEPGEEPETEQGESDTETEPGESDTGTESEPGESGTEAESESESGESGTETESESGESGTETESESGESGTETESESGESGTETESESGESGTETESEPGESGTAIEGKTEESGKEGTSENKPAEDKSNDMDKSGNTVNTGDTGNSGNTGTTDAKGSEAESSGQGEASNSSIASVDSGRNEKLVSLESLFTPVPLGLHVFGMEPASEDSGEDATEVSEEQVEVSEEPLDVDTEYYYERTVYAEAVLEEETDRAGAVEVRSYEEMKSAVENAEANSELRLLVADDIVFEEPIELNKSLFLNLFADGEKALSAASGRHFVSTASDIVLSIYMDSNIVLDGAGTGGGFAFGNETTRRLQVRLTGGIIQNCYANDGGGLFANTESGSIQVEDVVMRSCEAAVNGGGMYARISSGVVAEVGNTVFADCKAGLGGAVYAKAFGESVVKMAGGTIENCYGTNMSYGGSGGVFIQPFTGSRSEISEVNVVE